jgi:hypothetical protein
MNMIALRSIELTERFLRVTFEQFKTSVLLGLATLLVSIAGFMASSLWSLNEKMAVVVEKVSRHDLEIRDLQTERRKIYDHRSTQPKEMQ